MKYCLQCGSHFEDDSVRCPNCGAAANSNEQSSSENNSDVNSAPNIYTTFDKPSKKSFKLNKKLVIVVAACLVVASLAVVLFATGAYISLLPHSRMKLGLVQKKAVDSALDSFFDLIDTDAELTPADYSLGINLTLSDEFSSPEIEMLSELIGNLEISFGVGADANAKIVGLGIGYDSTPLVDATIISMDQTIGVYIPQLDSNYYTIDETVLYELMFDETYENNDFETSDFDVEAFRKDFMSILTILSKVSTKQNTTIESNVDVVLFDGEKSCKAALYTIEFTPEEISLVLNELCDYFESGESYIYNNCVNAVNNGSILSSYFAVSDSNIGSIDDLRNMIPDLVSELEEYPARMEIAMVGNAIVSQRIICDMGEYEEYFGYDSSIQGNTNRLMLNLQTEDGVYIVDSIDNISGGKHNLTVRGVGYYDIEEFLTDRANASLYTVTITASFDENTRTILGLPCGSYSLSGDELGVLAVFTVEEVDGQFKYALDLTPEDADDTALAGISITMSETPGCSYVIPDIEAIDLNGYTSEQINEIFEAMSNKLVESLSNMIYGLIMSGGL